MIYRYSYWGEDRHGMPIWACTRAGAGICGYGRTQKDALEAFLDAEQEPPPARYESIDCGPFEPADVGRKIYRDEDYA